MKHQRSGEIKLNAYPPAAIANWFIAKSRSTGSLLTPMQIQKLIFFAHGYFLAFTDRPLIKNEFFRAWKYGPVLESLYHRLKKYKANPVVNSIEAISDDPNKLMEKPKIPASDSNTQDLLDQIWNMYGDDRYSGEQLSLITHKKGSPWEQHFDKENPGQFIPNVTIKEYYKRVQKSQ